MIDKLKKSNPTLQIYSVTDAEFNEYGRVLNIDSDEIVKVGEEIPLPESGVSYSASLKEFESCEIAELIRDNCFGQLLVQIGYCRGHNSMMNAMEWHTSSEINIAVTPLILLLAHRSDIQAGMLDSADVKAFYLEKGQSVEVYATSLHYCPCQVSDNGFRCVVALPTGTNLPLEKQSDDPLLVAKNKWLIAHINNEEKLKQGVVAGITGTNYQIKY